MPRKCPSCGESIRRVNMEGIDIYVKGKPEFDGVSYSCPSCHAILSVSVDPFALKSDTVAGVMREMKKILGR